MSHVSEWRIGLQMFFAKHVTPPRPHRLVYQLTGGLLGSRLPSVAPGVLLLTTNGRKSGKPRTTPLIHFPIDQHTVVAATNNGDDRHPDWYWNIIANPDAVAQIGRRKRQVRAHQVEGDQRRRLWERITEVHPLFAEYQRRTEREIPVIVLEPAP
jgi:F420H(2)-dependent quinone reductase